MLATPAHNAHQGGVTAEQLTVHSPLSVWTGAVQLVIVTVLRILCRKTVWCVHTASKLLLAGNVKKLILCHYSFQVSMHFKQSAKIASLTTTKCLPFAILGKRLNKPVYSVYHKTWWITQFDVQCEIVIMQATALKAISIKHPHVPKLLELFNTFNLHKRYQSLERPFADSIWIWHKEMLHSIALDQLITNSWLIKLSWSILRKQKIIKKKKIMSI